MSVTSEAACYVLFRRGSKLLFVLRSQTGYMDGQYSLPAGHVEPAETYAIGAAREAMEEVGLTVTARQLRHVFTLHRFVATSLPQERTDVFFEALDWTGEPVNAEPHKHSEIDWLPATDLPAGIMDYQRYALEQIERGQTYGEYGWKSDEVTKLG